MFYSFYLYLANKKLTFIVNYEHVAEEEKEDTVSVVALQLLYRTEFRGGM